MLVLQTIHAKTEENVSPLTMALFVIVVKLISVEFSANKVSENYYHTLNFLIDDDLLTSFSTEFTYTYVILLSLLIPNNCLIYF